MTSELVDMIKRQEGFVPHAYTDSLGYLTIGYGRLIDKARRGGISEDEAEYLLGNDIVKVTRQLERHDWYHTLSRERQMVMINMGFNLGVDGLLKFKNMIAAIEARAYKRAADEMLDSRWATQVKGRAVELSNIMRTGELNAVSR